MHLFQLSLLPIYFITIAHATTTLFDGDPSSYLPLDAPAACIIAFNTTLNCDPVVQILQAQKEWAGWAQGNLTALCVQGCRDSLESLRTTVNTGCGSYTPAFNGYGVNADQILDFYLYKFDKTCLKDGAAFCHLQEQTWDIGAMVAAGQATWPIHTNKTYPDWNYDPINGTNQINPETGEVIPPYNDNPANFTWKVSGEPSALDYFYQGDPPLKANMGWDEILEYDEYPLEIQCAPCTIDRFKVDYSTQWGGPWDEVIAQAWENMKLNCALTSDTFTIYPGLDIRGPPDPSSPSVVWDILPTCDQTVNQSAIPGDPKVELSNFAFANNITTAGVIDKNDNFDIAFMANGSYCAPFACAVVMLPSDMGAEEFLQSSPDYAGITITQFAVWNPSANLRILFKTDVVCVGPPGGAYVPPSTTVAAAFPTIYTTTATPVEPTPSGTIPNCGKYYEVQLGDFCNTIALNFSITFSELIDLNPSLDSACSNLLTGLDYCVASVNGTTVPHQSTTRQPASTSSSLSSTISSTSPSATPSLSLDGTCGPSHGGTVCPGSGFGSCCSTSGFCGSTSDYCGHNNCVSGSCYTQSTDGTCGSSVGTYCEGSTFGSCCSTSGFCGDTSDYCGHGNCQSGSCYSVSTDGTCGPDHGNAFCDGSAFGSCCSTSGFCGSTNDYCAAGDCYSGACEGGVSPDGTCGPSSTGKYVCEGSAFGTCCSIFGSCGSTLDYCGPGNCYSGACT